jgi:hypothetical protein
VTQYVRRRMAYPCPFDCTGKHLGDAFHPLTEKSR